MQNRRLHQSILFCILAMMMFAAADICAKQLSATTGPLQIGWYRYLGAVVGAGVYAAARARLPRSMAVQAQLIRGAGLVAATVFLVAGLQAMPVAQATALVFVSPFFVAALSILLLRESVGAAQWIAASGGLFGVLVILRPGLAPLSASALLPILSALSWAIGLVYTRRAAARDDPATTLAYSAIIGFGALSVLMPFVFVTPAYSDAFLGAGTATMWCGAHVCIVMAYRHPDILASRLAPYSYTQMIWIIALSYIAFAISPDLPTVAGCGIIAASGVWAAAKATTDANRRPTANVSRDAREEHGKPTDVRLPPETSSNFAAEIQRD